LALGRMSLVGQGRPCDEAGSPSGVSQISCRLAASNQSAALGQHRTLGCLQQRGCSLLLRRCIFVVQRCDHVANQFVDLSNVVASARANAEVSDDRASGRHDDQVLTHSAAREERVARRMRHVPGHFSFAEIAVDDVGPEAGTIASVEGLRSRTSAPALQAGCPDRQ
jgi:hypothetical protein